MQFDDLLDVIVYKINYFTDSRKQSNKFHFILYSVYFLDIIFFLKKYVILNR